ncbi:MAG: transglutaminase-like domain-containing protein [Candidatus Dormibacteraeota bacterium]|nr:transglutaminase-like domain-containing protein [Candidatus Dormibacteraeota bacterium]
MEVVEHFAELVRKPESEIDLARGALLIAAAADPALDPEPPMALLDEFSQGVGDLVGLCRRLFVELGFRGDTRSYHSPVNSFLDRVLERRLGIPITLSVVTLEVASRAGMALEPIGMPAHFLVRDPRSGLYIDSFGATVLDDKGCEDLFREVSGSGPEVPFRAEMRPVVGPREILARILLNLAHTYRVNVEPKNLEWVLRLRLVIPGSSPEEAIQLARTIAAQGRVREAVGELEERASVAPDLAPGYRRAARVLLAQLS